MHRLLCLALLVTVVCTGTAAATTCAADSECPGYVAGRFCENSVCLDGACERRYAPCEAACSETLQACVACAADSDCERGYCDTATGVCGICASDADCPRGDWCHGGPWSCDRNSGRCETPPADAQPCTYPDARSCDAERELCWETRAPCGTDRDCNPAGTGGHFCQVDGEQICDSVRGLCVPR